MTHLLVLLVICNAALFHWLEVREGTIRFKTSAPTGATAQLNAWLRRSGQSHCELCPGGCCLVIVTCLGRCRRSLSTLLVVSNKMGTQSVDKKQKIQKNPQKTCGFILWLIMTQNHLGSYPPLIMFNFWVGLSFCSSHLDKNLIHSVLSHFQRPWAVRDCPPWSLWQKSTPGRLATSPPSCLHVSWIYHRLPRSPLPPTDWLTWHDLQVRWWMYSIYTCMLITFLLYVMLRILNQKKKKNCSVRCLLS